MKDLIRIAIEGIDLDARDRARWRIVVLVGLVLGIIGLHQAGAWEVVEHYDLIGLSLAIAASLLGLGQTIKRHSKPPPLPGRVLTREETGQHRTIRQPGLPLDTSDFELTENDTDTDRPPASIPFPSRTLPEAVAARMSRERRENMKQLLDRAGMTPVEPPPVLPLDDDDNDTSPQTPGAIRRAGR